MAATRPASGGGPVASGLISGPATAPPSEPPPPAPPGLWQGQQAASGPNLHDCSTLEKQKEISGTIAAQVHRLLEQARVDTENKVKIELKTIRELMISLEKRLDCCLTQLEFVEPSPGTEPHMDAEQVGQLLSKIEQHWGQEIRTLKEELHQTILAHNHNADLIKHHKDTIDELKTQCSRLNERNSTRTAAEIQGQISKLEALPKHQMTQRKLDPLFERLTALEHKVRSLATAAAARRAQSWQYQVPMMPPGMRPSLGMGMPNPTAAMMASMGVGAGLMPGGRGAAIRPNLGGGRGALLGGAPAGADMDSAAMAAYVSALNNAALNNAEEDSAAALAADAGTG